MYFIAMHVAGIIVNVPERFVAQGKLCWNWRQRRKLVAKAKTILNSTPYYISAKGSEWNGFDHTINTHTQAHTNRFNAFTIALQFSCVNFDQINHTINSSATKSYRCSILLFDFGVLFCFVFFLFWKFIFMLFFLV